MLSSVEPIIHGHAPIAGRPVKSSAGTAITPEPTICAVIALGASALDLTTACQPACSAALVSAAMTSQLSIETRDSGLQHPVEVRRRAQAAVRQQRVIRNDAAALPAE